MKAPIAPLPPDGAKTATRQAETPPLERDSPRGREVEAALSELFAEIAENIARRKAAAGRKAA